MKVLKKTASMFKIGNKLRTGLDKVSFSINFKLISNVNSIKNSSSYMTHTNSIYSLKCFQKVFKKKFSTRSEKCDVLKKYQKLIDEKKLEQNESQLDLIKYLDHLNDQLNSKKSKFEELNNRMIRFFDDIDVEKSNELKNQNNQDSSKIIKKGGVFSSISSFFNYDGIKSAHNKDDDKSNNNKNSKNIRSLREFKNYEKMLEEYKNDLEIRGIYVYGSPGSGKTYLMDMFYEFVQVKKKRCHFNEFMLGVHQELHKLKDNITYKQTDLDPLYILATEMSKNINLLCFEEFQVTDIADAVILKRLFEILYKNYVVVVATSNRHPDNLYLQGLQRHLFIPFITELKQKCKVISVSAKDFRVRHDIVNSKFIFPGYNIDNPNLKDKFTKVHNHGHKHTQINLEELNKHIIGATDINMIVNEKKSGTNFIVNEEIHKEFNSIFRKLTEGSKPGIKEIEVMHGRIIKCSKWSRGVGYFHFSELCEEARGPADYIAVAQSCSTIALEGIPKFDLSKNRNALRRFINLVFF